MLELLLDSYSSDFYGCIWELSNFIRETCGEHRNTLAIKERWLGPEHPELARNLTNLAQILAESGNQVSALKAALQAESIGREHLRISARALSEQQALAYAAVRASGLDLALTLVARSRRGFCH